MKLYCGLYGSQDHQLHNVVGYMVWRTLIYTPLTPRCICFYTDHAAWSGSLHRSFETTAICVSPAAARVSAIALDSVVSMDDWGLSPQVGLVKVTRWNSTGAFQRV